MLLACLIIQLVTFIVIELITNCMFCLRWYNLFWIIFITSIIVFFASSITGIVLTLI